MSDFNPHEGLRKEKSVWKKVGDPIAEHPGKMADGAGNIGSQFVRIGDYLGGYSWEDTGVIADRKAANRYVERLGIKPSIDFELSDNLNAALQKAEKYYGEGNYDEETLYNLLTDKAKIGITNSAIDRKNKEVETEWRNDVLAQQQNRNPFEPLAKAMAVGDNAGLAADSIIKMLQAQNSKPSLAEKLALQSANEDSKMKQMLMEKRLSGKSKNFLGNDGGAFIQNEVINFLTKGQGRNLGTSDYDSKEAQEAISKTVTELQFLLSNSGIEDVEDARNFIQSALEVNDDYGTTDENGRNERYGEWGLWNSLISGDAIVKINKNTRDRAAHYGMVDKQGNIINMNRMGSISASKLGDQSMYLVQTPDGNYVPMSVEDMEQLGYSYE